MTRPRWSARSRTPRRCRSTASTWTPSGLGYKVERLGLTKLPGYDGSLLLEHAHCDPVNALAQGAVRGLGELFITLGIVLLLFVVWQLWWTDVTADPRADPADPGSCSSSGPTSRRTRRRPRRRGRRRQAVTSVPHGDAFALIRIPRFGKDYVAPILQGTSLDVLDKGVGHYAGAACPGQVGNFAVAGHRVTYAKPFNRIDELRPGDPIVIETANTWYVYRVVGARDRHAGPRRGRRAGARATRAQKPTEAMMTMTACHPKFSARERYVVFSKLDQTIAEGAGRRPGRPEGVSACTDGSGGTCPGRVGAGRAAVVLVLAVVAVLFLWGFTCLAPHMPFNDGTVTE